MNEQQERSAFERWYEGHCLPGEADWFRRDPDEPDEYKHGHTSEAWAGWKARAALAANVPVGFVMVPVEPTPEMVAAGREFDHPKNVWAAMLAAAPTQAQQPLTAHQIKMLPLTIEMGWDEIVRVIERAHGIGASGEE